MKLSRSDYTAHQSDSRISPHFAPPSDAIGALQPASLSQRSAGCDSRDIFDRLDNGKFRANNLHE
jgi:hypothetical protein